MKTLQVKSPVRLIISGLIPTVETLPSGCVAYGVFDGQKRWFVNIRSEIVEFTPDELPDVYTQTEIDDLLMDKANIEDTVLLTGDQIIDGVKTFKRLPQTENVTPALDAQLTSKNYVDTVTGKFVRKDGSTMTGALILNADPVTGLQAATKDYVDDQITDLESTALSFKGFVSSTEPVSDLRTGLYWYESDTMPSIFPVRVKTYDGSSWGSGTTDYTATAFDLWSNLNDDSAQFYFGDSWRQIDFSGNTFNSNHFNVSNGLVSIKEGGITDAEIAGNAAISQSKIKDLTDDLSDKANAEDVYTKTETDDLLDDKQNVLTAGTGITLANDILSADTSVLVNHNTFDTRLLTKQDVLTAGANITIADNIISATSGSSSSTWTEAMLLLRGTTAGHHKLIYEDGNYAIYAGSLDITSSTYAIPVRIVIIDLYEFGNMDIGSRSTYYKTTSSTTVNCAHTVSPFSNAGLHTIFDLYGTPGTTSIFLYAEALVYSTSSEKGYIFESKSFYYGKYTLIRVKPTGFLA